MSDRDNPYLYIPELHGYDDSSSTGMIPMIDDDDIIPFGTSDNYFYENLLKEEEEKVEKLDIYEPEVVKTPEVGWFEGITKTAYNESLTRVAMDTLKRQAGMLTKDETTKYDLTGYDPTAIEGIAAAALSFLMPADLAITFIPGGIAGKGVQVYNKTRTAGRIAFNAAVKSGLPPRAAEQAILKGGSRLLYNMARYGTGDASYGFARSVAEQYDSTTDFGEVDYIEALERGAKDFLIGSTLGATETIFTGARSRLGEIANKPSSSKKKYFQESQHRAYGFLPAFWGENLKVQKALTGQIAQKSIESSALAVMTPLLHEERAPEMDDWIKTAGMVFGFPAALKTPGRLARIVAKNIPESQKVKDAMVQLKDRMNVGDFRVIEAINQRIDEANLGAKAGREIKGAGFVEYPIKVGAHVSITGKHRNKGEVGLVTEVQHTSSGRDYAWVSLPSGRRRISLKSLTPQKDSVVLKGKDRELAGVETKTTIIDSVLDMADTLNLSHPQLLTLAQKVSGKTPEGLFSKAGTAEDVLNKLDRRSYLKDFNYDELYRLKQSVKYGSTLSDSYLKRFEHLEESLSPDARSDIFSDPQVPGSYSTAEYLRSAKDNWITPVADVISKMGKPGKVISQFLKDVDFQKDRYKAIRLGEFESVLKILDKGDLSYTEMGGAGAKNFDILIAALEPEMYSDVIKRWEKAKGRKFNSKDPQLKLAVAQWNKLTKQVGKDILQENIIIKDADTGEKRLMVEDDLLDVYFRRIITPEFRKLLYEGGQHESVKAQLAEQLILGSGDKSLIDRFTSLKEKGKTNKLAESNANKLIQSFWQTFMSFSKFQETGPHAGNIENFRKLKLKSNKLNIDGKEYKVFREDFGNVGRIWLEQSANYKHAVRAYGQNMEKAGLMLSALSNATRNPADVEFARRAIQWQVGLGKEISEIVYPKGLEKASRGITGYTAWSALSAPSSGAKNIVTGQAGNIGAFGTLNSVHGILDMLTYNPMGRTMTELFQERGLGVLNVRKNLKDSYELARRSGAIMSGQRSLELSQLAGGNIKKYNPGLMYPTELFNRMSSVFISRRAYQESIKKLSGVGGYDKVWTKTRAYGLLEDYFGMSKGMIEKARKRYKTWGTFDNQLIERASYHGQAKTQGSTAVPYMPAWVQRHENVARPLTIFQRMAYRAAYNIRDGVMKPILQGNPMPLARYGVALGLGGEALFEFNKFLVGQIGEMKAETEKTEWQKTQERFMKAEGLAILTNGFQDEGLSYSMIPATYKMIKEGVVLGLASIRGSDVSWRQALERNFENVAFWRMLNKARGNLKAKGYDYVTDAFGMESIKAIPTKGKTVEGMKYKISKKLARDLQYDFADKAGYEKKDRREQSATDWVESNSPYHKQDEIDIYSGDQKDIAQSFDAAFMLIQAQEEQNGVKTNQARKTAISRMKSLMRRQAPITLSKSSYGRQQSKYRDFLQSLSDDGKKRVREAEKDWRERQLYINKALRKYSTQYNLNIFNFQAI